MLATNKALVKILIIGYRKGLCEALERRQLPFALWDEKLNEYPTALHFLKAPFPHSAHAIKAIASQFLEFGPFTHVIAGTEASVYPASVSRRILQARKSKDSIVLSCHDKLIMKEILQKNHVPMTQFIHAKTNISSEDVVKQLGLPVVIKGRKESGGRSTVFCNDETLIQRAQKRYLLFEKFIDAPEASIESFIDNGEIRFQSITQYYKKKHINIVPALLDAELKQQLFQLNEQVIKHLKLSWGMTHLEVYLTPDGPLFGEIALRPPGGYIMELLKTAYGFNPWEALVATELKEEYAFPKSMQQYSAAIVLHPGAGTVIDIVGIEALKQHPSCQKIKLKVKVGSVINERSSVGQDVGLIILSAKNQEQLLQAISFVEETVKIELES